MNFLGVGPLELILVLLVMFLVIGPKDMAKTGKKFGRFLTTVRKSELWSGVNRVSQTIRDLPTTLIREAELEDVKKEFELNTKELKSISKEFQPVRINEIKAEIQSSMELKPDKKDTLSIADTPDKAA